MFQVQKECKVLQETCESSLHIIQEDVRTMEAHTEDTKIKEVEDKLSQLSIKYDELGTKMKSGGPGGSAGAISEELKGAVGKVDQLESGSAIIR